MIRYVLVVALFSILSAGCLHTHSELSVNINTPETRICTKYRYRPTMRVLGSVVGDTGYLTEKYAKWQPDVFDVKGIPIMIEEDKHTLNESGGNWSGPLMGLTLGIFPQMKTEHCHEVWSFGIVNKALNASMSACRRRESAASNNPMSFLVFTWDEKMCFENGPRYSVHSYGDNIAPQEMEMEYGAKAFAMAAWLKEMEDSGRINDSVAANAMSALKIMEVSASRRPFEIEKCEFEDGRDFAYSFVLGRKGGGNVALAEYGAIRGAFREAIKEQYCIGRPGVNPRALVVDFTECSLRNGRVVGRVVVLTIDIESLSYDSASRTGRMSVRIGDNQFEDARRFVRKKIEELASMGNVVVEGDSISPGAVFHIGNETLRDDGILEVEFRTE